MSGSRQCPSKDGDGGRKPCRADLTSEMKGVVFMLVFSSVGVGGNAESTFGMGLKNSSESVERCGAC